MKRNSKSNISILLFLLLSINICLAQKQKVEIDSYLSWQNVKRPTISPNGIFAAYEVENYPNKGVTVHVRETKGKWNIKFPTSKGNGGFSEDGKYFLFMSLGDTLNILNLSTKTISHIANVLEYNLIKNANEQWLISKLVGDSIAIGTIGGQPKFKLKKVKSYVYSPTGGPLVYQVEGLNSPAALFCLDLASGKNKEIFTGKASDLIFDQNGKQICFAVGKATGNEIWYYERNLPSAVKIVSNLIKLGTDSFLVNRGSHWGFSSSSDKFYFGMSAITKDNDSLGFPLDIMGYQDKYIEKSYVYTYSGEMERKNILATINLNSKKIKQITREGDVILGNRNSLGSRILIKRPQNEFIPQTADFSKVEYYLSDLDSGSETKVASTNYREIRDISLSPNKKFVVFFDSSCLNVYNVTNGHHLTVPVVDIEISELKRKKARNEIYYWGNDDDYFVYGSSKDIYLLNTGTGKSEKITGIDNANIGITFSPLKFKSNPILLGNNLILAGLENLTKDISFYSVNLKTKEIKKLYGSNFNVGSSLRGYISFEDGDILSSANQKSFVVSMERKDVSRNFFYTQDFRNFTPISNNHPEKKYEWHDQKLLSFRDSRGKLVQGILNLPPDLDKNKKYPLIVDVYEGKSHTLNQFKNSTVNSGQLNIPYMLSKGFLVFEPDIFVKSEQPGEDALQSVETSVKELIKYPYVDSLRIGMSGASFGGFETRYIVTKTNLHFAAVMSNCGLSNFTDYELLALDKPTFRLYPGQYLIKQPLAISPKLYLEASAVFRANNIACPMLMVHNQLDKAVSYKHSVELFMLLRELQKPVWWLNYNNEGHSILNAKAARDVDQRILSFFDHYLKGAPMPNWMSDHRKY